MAAKTLLGERQGNDLGVGEGAPGGKHQVDTYRNQPAGSGCDKQCAERSASSLANILSRELDG